MSIFKKLKDVLFEEEEYTEPIKIREEKKEEVPIRPRQVEQVEKQTERIVFDDSVDTPVATKISPSPEKSNDTRAMRAESERELFKKEPYSRGIKISHIDNRIYIDVYCILKYGVSISAVAESLRKSVKYSVENFTGMLVDAVNVHVVGVRV